MKTEQKLIQICLISLALIPATSQAQPVVTKVAAGENDTLFMKNDGSLWGMGDSSFGKLGSPCWWQRSCRGGQPWPP